ncbi:MAG TPA: aspartyl-phosphate phosphatase Spo0E family protein [Syntrophomonadaceae bacterium]|nr:aspartyl-phosphate phosphatase Spo0E family protein [Syntrophomonadaceae bacterium]
MSKEKNRIEIARTILNNAVIMNMSDDLILKISEKLDKYISDYHYNHKEIVPKYHFKQSKDSDKEGY